MNIVEHRLTISHQLEELSEASLIEVEKLIARLKSKKIKAQFYWLHERFSRLYGR